MVTESLVSSNSALSQWFRVQGRSHSVIRTTSSKKFISNILPLPELLLNDRSHLSYSKKASKARQTNTRMSNYSGSTLNLGGIPTDTSDKDEPFREQSNLFYSRCIDDIVKLNEPNFHMYDVPKELTYVQNIPNLKYSTVGAGCLWEIEIKRIKCTRKK